ncbi:L(+)-tartrate dehydratase subunit alpha [Romboutsia hominis]|uniref:L(+)-tartrate dehydratase subunit alpha n=1 Tax=Romboutsia hominis TaxID=1507512 RepID=A0A2P2BNJ8_9FIRM|nr:MULTISPECIES: fumarate hydratase [Romboutsia]CEI71962.1 L(+)-tartrate dehydratase subunit alpha [Romboutsia hominis]
MIKSNCVTNIKNKNGVYVRVREIKSHKITEVVKKMCIDANINLGEDVVCAIHNNLEKEESELGKNILHVLLENIQVANEKKIPICQDTGMAVFFVKVGQEVLVRGSTIEVAINEGVRQGYEEGYLRKSVVDPINRINTKDNTPAIIHYEMVKGDKIEIEFAPKGFGSENMSKMKMLKPSDGVKGIKEFIINTVSEAGPNPCPPIVVGVGVGGTIDKCAQISKKALLRNIGEHSKDRFIAELERELLAEINKLGIGPQGLGGNTTALSVNIETFPTHIAGLPVVVNINCHASRHKKVII